MNAIRSLMMSAIDRDHGAILFFTANPPDEVFGSHRHRASETAVAMAAVFAWARLKRAGDLFLSCRLRRKLCESSQQTNFMRLQNSDGLQVVTNLIHARDINKTVEPESRTACAESVPIHSSISHLEINRLSINYLSFLDKIAP